MARVRLIKFNTEHLRASQGYLAYCACPCVRMRGVYACAYAYVRVCACMCVYACAYVRVRVRFDYLNLGQKKPRIARGYLGLNI